MKALVKTKLGPDCMQYMDVPEPVPGDHDIKVKVYACGICGTDIHLMHDTYPSNPPIITGHEFSGVVAEVGKDVTDFKVGDRIVTLTAIETCEECEWCRQGLRIAKHEKDSRACRDAFALTLKDMMAADKSVCYVDCDLMGCVNTKQLMAAYPDRALEAGIAEANAAGVCAGLAATGKKVYLHTFGTFASRRIYDQIYMSAAYAGLPVHVFGSDAGVCAAFNGGTHMPLEDAAMYMAIPHAVVTDPCDYAQLASVTRQTADCDCVTYTRFVRKDIVQVYGDGSVFQLGKGVVLRESSCDAVTVIASGIMVDEALKAGELLEREGISVRVVDMFTWKPLDEELVVKCAAETGAIVTAENHNVTCGLGSAVANCLAKNRPAVQEFVGVQDEFGQVGPQSFLMDEYGLRAANIVAAVRRAIQRK